MDGAVGVINIVCLSTGYILTVRKKIGKYVTFVEKIRKIQILDICIYYFFPILHLRVKNIPASVFIFVCSRGSGLEGCAQMCERPFFCEH